MNPRIKNFFFPKVPRGYPVYNKQGDTNSLLRHLILRNRNVIFVGYYYTTGYDVWYNTFTKKFVYVWFDYDFTNDLRRNCLCKCLTEQDEPVWEKQQPSFETALEYYNFRDNEEKTKPPLASYIRKRGECFRWYAREADVFLRIVMNFGYRSIGMEDDYYRFRKPNSPFIVLVHKNPFDKKENVFAYGIRNEKGEILDRCTYRPSFEQFIDFRKWMAKDDEPARILRNLESITNGYNPYED